MYNSKSRKCGSGLYMCITKRVIRKIKILMKTIGKYCLSYVWLDCEIK